MAEGNGSVPKELPSWLYRGVLLGFVGFLTWQASKALEKLDGLSDFAVRANIRLDQHDKTLETHERRIWSVERMQPGSLVGPR